jgi:hypothetical protein
MAIPPTRCARQLSQEPLKKGATLEDVQRTVGHEGPSTTQLDERGQFTPQKSAALDVAYEHVLGPYEGRRVPRGG